MFPREDQSLLSLIEVTYLKICFHKIQDHTLNDSINVLVSSHRHSVGSVTQAYMKFEAAKIGFIRGCILQKSVSDCIY
jgi:hypothetical protein